MGWQPGGNPPSLSNLMNAQSATKPDPVTLDGSPLSTEAVRSVARDHAEVVFTEEARARVASARAVVAAAAEDADPVYGLNTGFGSLSKVRVTVDQVHEIQRNIVRSHAAGVGTPLPADVVRATMLVLAASLARGHSGVEPRTIDRILWHLAQDILPVVPSRVGRRPACTRLRRSAPVRCARGARGLRRRPPNRAKAPREGCPARGARGCDRSSVVPPRNDHAPGWRRAPASSPEPRPREVAPRRRQRGCERCSAGSRVPGRR